MDVRAVLRYLRGRRDPHSMKTRAVEEAGRFMADHKDRPFFIYFAMNMPHYPYQGDAKWLEHYRDLKHPTSERVKCRWPAIFDLRFSGRSANAGDLPRSTWPND